MILGISGLNASGKGEVVRFLEERSFYGLSLSDVIRNQLRDEGTQETRERMIEAGIRLRAEGGSSVLADRTLATMQPDRHYAIDSIRHPAEVEALRAQAESFTLVWVDAPLRLRFERLRSRGRPGDPRDTGELASFEARERGGSDESGGAGQQLGAVEALADHRVSNDGDLGALHRQLQHLMQPLDGKTP